MDCAPGNPAQGKRGIGLPVSSEQEIQQLPQDPSTRGGELVRIFPFPPGLAKLDNEKEVAP